VVVMAVDVVRWQPWPMGEAGAGAAPSSVAEVVTLEAAARGISARPGMCGGSHPVTAAMVAR
jgi:hypothetical protein